MTSMSTLTGKTLGQYKIVTQIGQGGMATVFQAYQSGLNRDVALKVLSPLVAEKKGFTERFSREAQAIGNLHHPNILPVYDFGQDKGYGYIAMRYIPKAKTLTNIMKEPLKREQVTRLLSQIAGALDHAHQSGIIHRDIKPSNILMDGDWVLLSDFGLAKMVEDSSELTGTGVGIGTPIYMSPEQAKGEKVDHRTDIYSLGIILYEMLTGQVPHKAETPMATVIKKISEPLPLPRSINPGISKPVENVLLKALAISPLQRFNSAEALVDALEAAYAHEFEPAAADISIKKVVSEPVLPPKKVTPPIEAAQQMPGTRTPANQKSGGVSPVEISLMTLLGVVSVCGVSGAFLMFGTDDAGQSNLVMVPACLGMTFASVTSILMIWLRNRKRAATAWLAMGVVLWFVGINILGWGGFAALSPGDDMGVIENLGFSVALCFMPGGFLALLGLLAYGMDFRRGRQLEKQIKIETEQMAPSKKTDRMESKLQRAAEYRKHIDKLIKQKKDGPFADQLIPIIANLTQWENHLRQLVRRVRDFEADHIIQRDIVDVPAKIKHLQTQLGTESNPQMRKEINETLESCRTHQQQLEALVTLTRRTELDIDETLSTIGAIYSQLQLLGAKEINKAQARRLSADINEQAHRLNDLLEAMDDVYESSAGFNE